MRRWFKAKRREVCDVPSGRQPLSDVLRECAGNWIAIDRATNALVEVASTADALVIRVRERRLKNVAILRAPDPSEPELVGLG